MATVEVGLEKFVAAQLHNHHQAFRRSGRDHVIRGTLGAAFGVPFLFIDATQLGLLFVISGMLFIALGLYERRVQRPRVIMLSTIPLVGYAALFAAAIAVAGKSIWDYWIGGAIAVGLVAWGVWSSKSRYHVYSQLLQERDVAADRELADLLERLRVVNPDSSPAVAEFIALPSFEQRHHWRADLGVDPTLFVVSLREFLRPRWATEVVWIPRNALSLEQTGNNWSGKKIRARILLNGEVWIKRAEMSPGSFRKLSRAGS